MISSKIIFIAMLSVSMSSLSSEAIRYAKHGCHQKKSQRACEVLDALLNKDKSSKSEPRRGSKNKNIKGGHNDFAVNFEKSIDEAAANAVFMCAPFEKNVTPEHLIKHSKIRYTISIKGMRGSDCNLVYDVWHTKMICPISQEVLSEFEGIRNKEELDQAIKVHEIKCLPQGGMEQMFAGGQISSLLHPMIKKSKDCFEGNQKKCEEFESFAKEFRDGTAKACQRKMFKEACSKMQKANFRL